MTTHASGARQPGPLVALALAVLGLVMIVIGWPEAARWQEIVLEVANLVLAAAIATLAWHFITRQRLWTQPTRMFAWLRWVCLGFVGVGLVLAVVGWFTTAVDTQLGIALVWLGLGLIMVFLAGRRLDPDAGSWEPREPAAADLFDATARRDGPARRAATTEGADDADTH